MKKYKAYSENVLDYPSTLSMYEKESLAAEAKLRAEKPTGKNRKFPSGLTPKLTDTREPKK